MLTGTRRREVWASALLLVLVGCSSEDEPARGQLMIALSTDMSVPKDIDNIRVEVLRGGGSVVHNQTYWLEPGSAGDTKLPATLAVVAGEHPGEAVEVRVIGARINDARVFSKVETTIPEARVATLHVPMQWLCDGSASRIAEDTYDSACTALDSEEYSCVAGTCERVGMDVDDLPDFDPAAIFGGGAGPGDELGRCFDTTACFDTGEDVVPGSDCELELDVPSGGELNVALKFPAEDADGDASPGICGSEACYVPLDKDDRFGWRVDDAGTVHLPPAVCQSVDAGDAEAVRVCYTQQSKTLAFPTCGAWSSVGSE